MRVLIVHQNFSGQYAHLARVRAAVPGNEVVFRTQRADAQILGVRKILYLAARGVPGNRIIIRAALKPGF